MNDVIQNKDIKRLVSFDLHSVMVIISYREIESVNFGPIVRVYVAGSSGSGKTSFVEKFLKSNIFNYERIYYFHPDFYEKCPVNWETSINKEIIYRNDIPSIENIREMKQNSVLVFDDIFDQVESSKDMDYLFRVLSGKYKLHVIVMTQRYYSNGKFCVNIRNCCDYHVLMRNADESLTKRIARSLGHSNDITTALRLTENQLYPYIFVDKTQLARVNRIQVYIDVLSDTKILIVNSMKYYLISEKDFNASYKIVDKNLATNEDKNEKLSNESESTRNSWEKTRFGEAKRKRAIENHVKRVIYKLKKRSQL